MALTPPLTAVWLPWLTAGAAVVGAVVLVAVWLDRRHRRQLEELERRARAGGVVAAEHTLLDAVVETLREGVVVATPDGRVVVCNESALRIFGTRPEATALSDWAKDLHAVHSDVRTPVDLGDLLGRCLEGREPAPTDLYFPDSGPDGTHVRVTACTLRNVDGDVVGAALILVESEGGEWSDAERRALIEELEAKNRELERFTYTVAHEIRSPLVTLSGFLRLLRQDLERRDLDRARTDADRIQEAVDDMAELIEDLLQLSRSGVVIDAAGTVDLDALVYEVIRSMSGRIDEAGIEIAVRSPLPTVRGDGRRLLAVYQNLVENAIKFMGDQPAPRIEIGVRGDPESRVYYVADNGRGIPEQERARVFRIFERLDPSVEGTGVGLTLVKGIVEAHHGEAWIEDGEEGVGSVFCFTLPNGFTVP